MARHRTDTSRIARETEHGASKKGADQQSKSAAIKESRGGGTAARKGGGGGASGGSVSNPESPHHPGEKARRSSTRERAKKAPFVRATEGNATAPNSDPSKTDPMFTAEDRRAKDRGKGTRSQTKAGGNDGKHASQERKEKSSREQ